ncbi:hypothetical protein ABKV19_025479 [Rosa sericea]
METYTSPIKLKLMIDPLRQKVLFAEVGKDFVDFLFTLLPLPIGTIIGLLNEEHGMVGCLGKLYNSVENLSSTYLLNPDLDRDVLLNPMSPVATADLLNLLTQEEATDDESSHDEWNDDNESSDKQSSDDNESNANSDFYICVSCLSKSNAKERVYYVTDNSKSICPGCKAIMSTPAAYVAPPLTEDEISFREGSYVKDVVTYIVMDDLEVRPMSATLIMAMLKEFNVKDVSSLIEKVVHLGNEEGLKLLKASLQSESALSAAFLVRKEA